MAPTLGWIPCWIVAGFIGFVADEVVLHKEMKQPKMDEAGEGKQSAEETSYFSIIFMIILLFITACIIYVAFMISKICDSWNEFFPWNISKN